MKVSVSNGFKCVQFQQLLFIGWIPHLGKLGGVGGVWEINILCAWIKFITYLIFGSCLYAHVSKILFYSFFFG